MGMVERQKGHSFVVGTGGGAACCRTSLLTFRMSRKTANATMRKVMMVLMKNP
jgi:hypothetical protein